MPVSLPLLFAQGDPTQVPDWLRWLLLWGEPTLTDARWFGGLITWAKVVGLFCLLAWAFGWLVAAVKARRAAPRPARPGPATILGVVGLLGLAASSLLRVLIHTHRMAPLDLGGVAAPAAILMASIALLAVGIDAKLWKSVRTLGDRADLSLLVLLHLAVAAGFVVAALIGTHGTDVKAADVLVSGARLGFTYSGLTTLAWVGLVLLREAMIVRPRRLYAVAWHSVVEANRRMWAPWVVLAVFLVILAFTHWFLRPPADRQAEISRLFVGTLALLCSMLLTLMITIVAPIGLPQDIQNQTIYTVVSKPVRRLELVWGRMIGYMALVTVLLLVFGGISLLYLDRIVGGSIREADAMAARLREEGKEESARYFAEQAEQLRTRMSARVPLKGVLTFVDALGATKRSGIDVGQELHTRSYIEGATASRAVWQFGLVEDPHHRGRVLDRQLPVDSLLHADTIEWLENRMFVLSDQAAAAEERARAADLTRSESARLTATRRDATAEVERVKGELDSLKRREADLRRRAAVAQIEARKAQDEGRTAEADAKRVDARRYAEQARALHSPDVPVEMTFTVYRTTKGVVGEPVFASLKAIPWRPELRPTAKVFPVKEYYTNKLYLPASVLVGSGGRLRIEVGCIPTNQYLGVAEGDLYLLASQGGFRVNYMKGLFGIWLQAMVLTAIGVFAGTFLSWPVAFLTTLFFFIAGQVAFSSLVGFAMSGLIGGGPFESFIRLLTHDNLQADLTPTLGVVTAKTLDALVTPVMSLLAYVVPNFAALDVSNTVAQGFAVEGPLLLGNTLTALGYALPFSVAGYFILKQREVAA